MTHECIECGDFCNCGAVDDWDCDGCSTCYEDMSDFYEEDYDYPGDYGDYGW